MPCAECGHPLIVVDNHEDLRCPKCLNAGVVDQQTLQEKINHDRELLRDENLAQLLEDYSKDNLLLYLIERLNRVSHEFYQTRSLDQREFSYLNYLIKLIYPIDKSHFGDDQLEPQKELNEDIDTLLSTQSHLVTGLNHVEDGFRICLEKPVPRESKFLFGEYDIRDSEYRYCFYRCIRSLGAGDPTHQELFDKTQEKIRDFDRPQMGQADTLEEFGNASFEFIISLLFMASADEIVGDIYTTFPPDHVSVFDIKELLNSIDDQFTDDNDKILLQDHTLGWTNEEGLDIAGESTFNGNWSDVRDTVIVSQNNLNAHPFLFQLDVEIPFKKPSGRPPITRTKTRIVYPRFYSRILQFQIFPLLQNGDQDSGHDILQKVSKDRGQEFEKKVYQYLDENGFNAFYSAEIPGVDSSEIDVLAVNHQDNELWFIECKYLLPETDMNSVEGVERLNGKFDHKLFNEKAEAYSGEPTGQTFPEKIDEWLELEPGDKFTWKKPVEDEENVESQLPKEWMELDPRKMVISNLTPSYIEKRGVEFFTDLELVEMIEEGEARVYTAKHEMV